MSTFLFVMLILEAVFTVYAIVAAILSDEKDAATKFVGSIIRLVLVIVACVFGGAWATVIGIIYGAVGNGLGFLYHAAKKHEIKTMVCLVFMILFIVALANN